MQPPPSSFGSVISGSTVVLSNPLPLSVVSVVVASIALPSSPSSSPLRLRPLFLRLFDAFLLLDFVAFDFPGAFFLDWSALDGAASTDSRNTKNSLLIIINFRVLTGHEDQKKTEPEEALHFCEMIESESIDA